MTIYSIKMHAVTVASFSLSAVSNAARAKSASKVSSAVRILPSSAVRKPHQMMRGVCVLVRSSPEEEVVEMDPDANIEPCLVGWSDKDEEGVDVYCCEQPGGGTVCKTNTPVDQQECDVIEDDEGDLSVSCDDDDV